METISLLMIYRHKNPWGWYDWVTNTDTWLKHTHWLKRTIRGKRSYNLNLSERQNTIDMKRNIILGGFKVPISLKAQSTVSKHFLLYYPL